MTDTIPTTRRLVVEDWRRMSRLRMTRHTHAGAPVSTFASNPITNIDIRYQRDPHLAMGAFDGHTLKAFICCYQHQDFWVLDLMVSDGDPSWLQLALDACLEHYEARGVNQFYYAFPQKWARAYRSFWKAGVPRLRKYVIEDITVIDSHKVNADPFIWNHILHQVVVPVAFALRRSVYTPTPEGHI